MKKDLYNLFIINKNILLNKGKSVKKETVTFLYIRGSYARV